MYEQLYSYENLYNAFKKAKRGKNKKDYVISFKKKLDENLFRLQEELRTQTYKPKPLKIFILRDPKTRRISKSKFRDRVVHHALINIIQPVFQKEFIYDSHANQIRKGTLNALQRFDVFKRKVSKNNTRKCYVLKADIRHYFDNVNHEILLSIIRKKVEDNRVIWLIEQILANIGGGGRMRKGMPLGNLTSQFFANLYLNELDQYVKHILKIKYYIRYVDDFVIFSHSKEELEVWKEQINEFLKKHLKIELHPDKSYISLLSRGIPFLGFRIFYYHKLLRKSNIKIFERKMRELKILYKEKRIRREQVIEKLEGWMAYARYGNTYNYRREILRQFNRHFPIYHKNQIIRNKKIKNFYRKVYASKIEFSVQKTLFLVREGLDVGQIAVKRGIKEGTVWAHFVNLVEYGQLPIWNIISKKKIVKIMQNIRSTNETLKQIRERIKDRNISYDEIACVKAHLIMKEKIKISNYRRNQQQGK